MENDKTSATLAYYTQNAAAFSSGTQKVEFSSLQDEFLSFLKLGSLILDFGCGSGRDSRYFKEKGFEVIALDGCPELCALAGDYIGQNVVCSTFQDYRPDRVFDGIWACASLLHLDPDEIASVAKRLAQSLKDGGCFYVSFKYGEFSGMRNGRYFTDLTENALSAILEKIPSLSPHTVKLSNDVRPGRENERWLNAFLIKKSRA